MKTQGWEYCTLMREIDWKGVLNVQVNLPPNLTAEMNRYGAQGWELVNALDINAYQGASFKVLFVFKRPLAD